MQKCNIKGSILIWSMFLSLFVSISFVYISMKINKNIKQNSSIEKKFERENNIKSFLASSQNQANIGKDEYIKKLDNFHILRENEEENLLFSGSGNFSGTLSVENGGILYYYLKDSTNYFYSGVLLNGENKNFNLNKNDFSIFLKSIGGEIRYSLNYDNSFNSNLEKGYYKVEKLIGGRKIEKSLVEIK